MNLSRTLLVFGLLLAMLWVFGLMVAYKRVVGDESLLVPSLQGADAKVESIAVKRGGKDAEGDLLFVQEAGNWYFKQGDQKVRLERFRVDQLVSAVKKARKDDEFRPGDDLAAYQLVAPKLTYVLKGRQNDRDKEWTFKLGKETPDGSVVFANSSDRPDKAYAVDKKSVEDLYFKGLSTLRPKRLFEFDEATVNRVELKKAEQEVGLRRDAAGVWRFDKPALGFAGFEQSVKKDETKPGDKAGGVKGLLEAVHGLRVEEDDDFVAPGQPLARYGLEPGKEPLRVEVLSGGGPDKKETAEVLLVGKAVPGEKAYYARLGSDEGVVKLKGKQLEPVEAALAEPGKIRSKDVAAFDAGKVDLVTLKHGDKEAKLTKPEKEIEWKLDAAGRAGQKANEKAVQALLEAVQGKNAVLEFKDVPEKDVQKFDADAGLEKPGAVVAVSVRGAAEKDAKEKEKKEEKPVVTLAFGKAEGETVLVKRTLADGTVSRFTLGKAILDKVEPAEGVALAFLDPVVPGPETGGVTEVELRRGGDRIDLVRKLEEKAGGRWFIKDKQEPSGQRPADDAKANLLVETLSHLLAKKWVARVDAKTDLDAYGLKSPTTVVALIAKDRVSSPAAASATAALAASPWAGLGAALGQQVAGRGEVTTIQLGKESEKDKGVYALSSASDVVFLVDPEVLKVVREPDLSDRTVVLNTQPELEAGRLGLVAGSGLGGWLFASPLSTGAVHQLDPAKVKEIKIAVRKPEELRALAFRRADKGWQDQSGLQEFQVDPERVSGLVEKLARLQTDRFVVLSGGPRSDQKLTSKEASIRFDLTTDDGKTVTLLVGAEFERFGYFARSSAWPDVVFLVPPALADPILRRPVGYFSKERVAVAP